MEANPTERCLIACMANDLETVSQLCQTNEIHIHQKNEKIFKTACTLEDPLPMMDLLYDLYPNINLHIDNDIIAKQGNSSVLRWLITRAPNPEAWDDFLTVFLNTVHDTDLFHEILKLKPELLNAHMVQLLEKSAEQNNYELLVELYNPTIPINVLKLYQKGLHDDLQIGNWLKLHWSPPDILFKQYFYKESITICQWLLGQNIVINPKEVFLETTNIYKRWYLILSGSQLNVTSTMVEFALKYLIYESDMESSEAFLNQYSQIDINPDNCFLMKKFETKQLAIIIWLAEGSEKFNKCLYPRLFMILADYTSYYEIEAFKKSCKRYPNIQKKYTINWSYSEILKYANERSNFLLCDELLANVLWIDEVFNNLFEASLNCHTIKAVEHWYTKYPHLVSNFLQNHYHTRGNIINLSWLALKVPNTTFYENFRKTFAIKRQFNPNKLLCMKCKIYEDVIKLPCGHQFCFRSILEYLVYQNLNNKCGACLIKYKNNECIEYETGFFW